MDILPGADKAVVPIEKFTKYALEPKHPRGSDKARVFRSVLGYTKENAEILVARIKENVDKYPVVFKGMGNHGAKYEILMEIEGINGRKGVIVTAWQIDHDTDYPKLISAYVDI